MKKQLISFLFVSLASLFIGVLIAYVFRSKQKEQNIVSVTNKISRKDSIEIINKEHANYEAKFKQDSSRLSKQRDSFKLIYYHANVDLNIQRKKVVELSKYILTIQKDSSCSALATAALRQDSLIENLQLASDSLQAKNDSLVSIMAVRVSVFNNSFLRLNTQAHAQANIIDSLANKNASLIKNANKKYSVGIGVMGGLTPTGFGGCIGLSLTRTIFKF
jgi:hypothetical protein